MVHRTESEPSFPYGLKIVWGIGHPFLFGCLDARFSLGYCLADEGILKTWTVMFAPGEEPTVCTLDLCPEAGSYEQCKEIDSHKGKAMFCTSFCHKVCKGIRTERRLATRMKIDNPEEFSAQASSLIRRAIEECGGRDNLSCESIYVRSKARHMSEAKARRMTRVGGLENAIRRRNTNCDSPD
jgi:hypothetical protein